MCSKKEYLNKIQKCGIWGYYLIVIVHVYEPHRGEQRFRIYKNNLSSSVLFTIKYLMESINARDIFDEFYTNYNKNPEYFIENCAYFESLCKDQKLEYNNNLEIL